MYRGDRTRRAIAEPDGLRLIADLIVHKRDVVAGGYTASGRADLGAMFDAAMHAGGHMAELAAVVGFKGAERMAERYIDPQARRIAKRLAAELRPADVWPIRPQDGTSAPERDKPGRVDPITRRPRES